MCSWLPALIDRTWTTTNQTRPFRINAISLFQEQDTKVSAFENLSILWSIVIHELSSTKGFQQQQQPLDTRMDSCSCRTLFNLLISINRHITSLLPTPLLLLLHSINARLLPLGMWFTQFSDWQTNLSDCNCFCPIHNNFSFYSPFTHNYCPFGRELPRATTNHRATPSHRTPRPSSFSYLFSERA